MLRIRGVFFSWGKAFSLENIDFAVDRGSLTSLIGPNGSGKSTVLRIAAGLSKPQKGSVSLLNRELDKIGPGEKSKLVSYLPQFSERDLPFTVEQTVLAGRFPWLGRLGFAGDEEISYVKEIMKEFGLSDIADRSFCTLSGGERQRTLLASSLAQSSVFLALDEPTSSLDISHQAEIYRKLRKHAATGTTILMASHNISLASIYSDEIIILKEGKMEAKGHPAEIIDEKIVRQVFGEELSLVFQNGVPLIFPRPE
ncbi:ABC transporter ATP-binding protein [candidate division WOR-3 bacterium]|nr:ABC transporter ATP-binding protein [candidate division WOR-3 bacterium]